MTARLEERKVAARYARALFDGTLEKGGDELATAEKDLVEVTRMFGEMPELRQFLTSPAVPQQDKITFVEKQLAPNVSDWVGNLLKLLAENHRVEALPVIAEAFEALKRKHENIATAEVVTATELDDALAGRIEDTLKSMYGFNRVELRRKVDPGILGGMILKIQDKVIDGSFVGRLEDLRKQVG